ncbi:hypothetical protein AAFF_G00205340 [Aldrovandia affinis]|uniref:Uncharacterized protein n=1 Tax=Aldrovandia affinis TaxID=143900 RepID=A0AAD7W4X1_9TELE|nr:hypothetical protein AAFF_G00205340 [Aldrovandia affinis]
MLSAIRRQSVGHGGATVLRYTGNRFRQGSGKTLPSAQTHGPPSLTETRRQPAKQSANLPRLRQTCYPGLWTGINQSHIDNCLNALTVSPCESIQAFEPTTYRQPKLVSWRPRPDHYAALSVRFRSSLFCVQSAFRL